MSEDGLRVVLCTSPPSEAGALARALVEEQLVACVNIVPAVTSVYRWEGKLEEDTESLLIMKTTSGALETLQDRLVSLHSYSVPEVIALPVSGGSEAYAAWVKGALRGE